MRSHLNNGLWTVILIAVLVGGWVIAGVAGLLASTSRVITFAISNLVLMFDMLDLIARMWIKRVHGAVDQGPSIDLCLPEISKREVTLMLSPYAIIASVHDAADSIDRFVKAMQPFKDCVWLIDDGSKDDTLLRLRQLGWNCLDGKVNRKKPGALLHLIKSLPPEIQSVVVLDPDVRMVGPVASHRETLERVLSDFQRSGAASLSPRVVVRANGWLSECQALEYELSCGLGRKSLGDCCTNSGVSIYRRSALRDTLARHTLSVYAEDLENSVLMLSRGERVYYDDRLVFATDAKTTWSGWFSQRVGWSFGWAKVYIERLPKILLLARRGPVTAYQYLFYFGVGGIGLLPLKLLAVALLAGSMLNGIDDFLMLDWLPNRFWNDPLFFALCYFKSTLVVLVACCVAIPRGERLRHLITAPTYAFYALLHFVPVAVGFINYITLRLFRRRLYADHYDVNPRLHTRRELETVTTEG